MKITVFELLQSLKLVSRKIWVIEKYWNYHTAPLERKPAQQLVLAVLPTILQFLRKLLEKFRQIEDFLFFFEPFRFGSLYLQWGPLLYIRPPFLSHSKFCTFQKIVCNGQPIRQKKCTNLKDSCLSFRLTFLPIFLVIFVDAINQSCQIGQFYCHKV